IAAAQWGIGLAAIGWFGMMFSEKKIKGSLGIMTLPTIAYIVICLITSAFAERTGHSLASVWDNEWLLFSAVIIVAVKPDRAELRRIILLLLAAGIVSAFLGLGEHFTGLRYKAENQKIFLAYKIGNLQTYRPILFFGHTLSYAYDMGMLFFIATGLLIAKCDLKKNFLRLAVIFIGLAVVVAFSRGTWYAAIVTGAGLYFIVPETKIRKTILTTLAVILLGGILIPQFHQRVTIEESGDNASSDREVYWGIALKIWQDHPIMGIGADNWDLFYPRYKPASTTALLSNPDHPHNEYLNVLTSFGAFGLAAYLWMWAALLWVALKALKREHDPLYRGILIGGMGALICVLIAQVTQDIFHDFTNQLMWWFITGLMLVVIDRDGEQGEQKMTIESSEKS
ncbi:MAG TPA: O-antigen ligase family protein, partial [Candidatus Kapabacteria bacterium]|nr:O-antigen ligase family protein [Candidatus Kapabacteria bacterium]